MQKNLVKLEIDQVDRVWDACAPILKKALDRCEGYHDIDDIYHRIKDGHEDLWVMFDDEIKLAATTRIVHYPKKSVLEIPLLAIKDSGSLYDFRLMLDQVEGWAKEQGSEATVFFARRGWMKIFPEYKIKHTLMMKDYED